jgi:hypothetical protein
MNRFLKSSVLLLLILSAPAHGQPDAAVKSRDEAYKSVQAKLRDKQYSEAAAEAERVLEAPDLAANDKARFLNAAADAHLRQTPSDVTGATALYEKIVSDATIPNTTKIKALNDIANAYITTLAGQNLDEMDLSPAHAALGRALKLPDLKSEERAAALKNIGKLYEREDKEAEARATYQQILALEVGDRTKADAWRALADSCVDDGKSDEALTIYREQGWGLEPLYRRLGDTEQVMAVSLKTLDDPQAAENSRWITFTRLPLWDAYPKDLAAIRKVWDAYMPAFLEKDPNRPLFLLRKVLDKNAEPSFVEWAAPLLLQAPKISAKDAEALKVAQVEALAAQGETAALLQEAATIAANGNFTAATRLWAQLLAAGLKPGGDANVAKLVQSAKQSNQDKADATLRAARTALRAGDTPAARSLFAAYNGLFVQPARAAITCDFVPNAPFDIGSWLNSPLLKVPAASAKLDRPYGDNLEFLLLTDSAMTGRSAANGKEPSGDTDTDFHIACDDAGLHFFFYAYDTKAAEVLDGLVSGGSFEMYFAPGAHQAYYTFLTDTAKGGIEPKDFVTMYPNAQFRMPSAQDGTFKTETRATDKGFATYVFMSWQLFYDKLPRNGDKWQFEAIRWTRSGGFSFGGSQSVHNRSSWGDIAFSGLTPERLGAIKRAIIFQAVAKYRRAKGLTGALGNWNDAEVGDPAFYAAQVAPLVEKLDKYADRVSKDMTAAEVETIFHEAVPDWMEIEYRVAALRTQYLKAKLLQGAQP